MFGLTKQTKPSHTKQTNKNNKIPETEQQKIKVNHNKSNQKLNIGNLK